MTSKSIDRDVKHWTFQLVSGSSNAIDEAKKEAIDTHPDVAKSIQGVHKNLDVDHVTAVGFGFGRPCYNPGSFQVHYISFINNWMVKRF